MMDEIPIVSSTTPSLVVKELTNVQDAAYEPMRSKQAENTVWLITVAKLWLISVAKLWFTTAAQFDATWLQSNDWAGTSGDQDAPTRRKMVW